MKLLPNDLIYITTCMKLGAQKGKKTDKASAKPRIYLGAEGTKIFGFDNPRLLEKALFGKELHWKLLLLTKKY